MTEYTLHTAETAPADSKPLLEKSKASYGMVPNLHAVMAEAPSVLEAYQTVGGLFENSSLNAEEITVVWQTINVENECHYCVPAHTAVAHGMKVDAAISEALRNGTALPTPKLEALRTFTLQVVRERGHLDGATVQAFLDAGFTKRQILEVILGYSQKIMSNYINHIADTPLDAPFQKFDWKPQAA